MTGRDAEKAVRDTYQAAGFEVYLPPHAKYREQDIFGEWDLLCFGHGRLEAVQVKAGRDAAGINDWFRMNRVYEEHINDLRLGFVHVGETGWRVARSTAEAYHWVYDGRGVGDSSEAELLEVLRG